VVLISLLQGVGILVAVLAVFGIALYKRGLSESDARGLAFATLIFANVALILTNRSWTRSIIHTLRTPNKSVWLVIAGAIALLAVTLYVPVAAHLFKMAAQHPTDMLLAVTVGIGTILWFELFKALWPKALA
jgi:Ca2+-transporting ATPase